MLAVLLRHYDRLPSLVVMYRLVKLEALQCHPIKVLPSSCNQSSDILSFK